MSLYADVVRYPDLFLNIFRRELHGKYRGSVLGLFWTLINPLALDGRLHARLLGAPKAFTIEHYPLFVVSGLVDLGVLPVGGADVVLEPVRATDAR